MEVRKPTEEDLVIFKEWNSCGKFEERTCRPVKDGRIIPTISEAYALSFFEDGFEGTVGKFMYFDHNPRNRSCEFGYIINPEYRGQGLGERMIRFCIDYVFNDPALNLNKLYCQTAEFNVPSVKILEKIGLKKDGVLREHHELDGKLWSDFVFSVLRSEWETSGNKQ